MSKIITITFNPALDKSITVAQLIPERKLKTTSPVYQPGGGGINVSRAISKLGGQSRAVYLAGGFAGSEIARLLAGEGIAATAITIDSPTRENLIVTDLGARKQYLFDLPGAQVNEQQCKACLELIAAADGLEFIVVSGSVPPGAPLDIFRDLASIARQKNARLIVDTSAQALSAALDAGVYLIKPNLKEMGLLAGKKEMDLAMAADFAKELIRVGKCQVVVLSLGASGALLVAKEELVHIHPPEVAIKSTVGAGDSLLAGVILSLERKKSLREAVTYGVACGTAVTMSPGTELCRREQAERLYQIMTTKPAEAVH